MRALLEQEGIAATVRDEFLAGVAPHTSLVTGGARVVVPPEDAERAAAVLRANRSLAALREAPGSHPLDERCPRCGSASLERERRGRMGALWTTLLLGVPLLLARERLRCQACDYRYSG